MKSVICIVSVLFAIALTGCTGWEASTTYVNPTPTPSPVTPVPITSPAPSGTPETFGALCPANTTCLYTGAQENVPTTMGCQSGVLTVNSITYGVAPKTESCLTYAAAECNGDAACTVDFSNTDCAGDPDVGVYKAASAQVTCGAPADQNDINTIVAAYNATRTAQGSESIIPGLDCTLYTVPTTTTAISTATLTTVGSFDYVGVFNQANALTSTGFNVLPTALQPIYQNWIVVKCNGELVNTDNAYHEFSVTSDDGSILVIDGATVVNNDGLHSTATKSGSKFLSYGVHTISVEYFQGQGYESMIVDQDNNLLPAANLYH